MTITFLHKLNKVIILAVQLYLYRSGMTGGSIKNNVKQCKRPDRIRKTFFIVRLTGKQTDTKGLSVR